MLPPAHPPPPPQAIPQTCTTACNTFVSSYTALFQKDDDDFLNDFGTMPSAVQVRDKYMLCYCKFGSIYTGRTDPTWFVPNTAVALALYDPTNPTNNFPFYTHNINTTECKTPCEFDPTQLCPAANSNEVLVTGMTDDELFRGTDLTDDANPKECKTCDSVDVGIYPDVANSPGDYPLFIKEYATKYLQWSYDSPTLSLPTGTSLLTYPNLQPLATANVYTCAVCPAGYKSSGNPASPCISCAAGTSKSTANQMLGANILRAAPWTTKDTCEVCAAHTFSAAAATKCAACPDGAIYPPPVAGGRASCTTPAPTPCKAGHFCRNNKEYLCTEGTYQDATGQSKCVECPRGKSTQSGTVSDYTL